MEKNMIYFRNRNINVRRRLKQIYTAKMCSDLTDVIKAMEEVYELAKAVGNFTEGMNKRWDSLEKKKEKLIKKITKL